MAQLNLTSVAGLSSFSGYGTNSITIVGPTAAVDAIIDTGVIYTPNESYNGGDTLTIKDTDSFGGSATQNIAITVKPNEAPVLAADTSGTPSGTHAITELTGKTGDAADNDTASGTLSFTDVNFFDTHTVSNSVHSITWSGGGTLPSGLDLVLASALSTSVTTDSAGMVSGTGSIGFTFSAADRNFDFLAKDETLTVTYDVTVKDDDNAISTQPVTITITGTNDAPVITSGDAKGISEDLNQTGQDTPALTTSGTIAFTDVDLSDTHTVPTPTFVSAVWSNGTVPSDTQLAVSTLGALPLSTSIVLELHRHRLRHAVVGLQPGRPLRRLPRRRRDADADLQRHRPGQQFDRQQHLDHPAGHRHHHGHQ